MRRSAGVTSVAFAVCTQLACGGEGGGDTGDIDCRALLAEADCMAAGTFELDDGRTGSCRWFTGQATSRSGDVCNSGASQGICLAAGPTQMNCTYAPLDEAYPATCGGTTAVPDIWVRDGDEVLLLSNVCGPSVADPMSGRCGADPGSEPAQCECLCL